MKLTPDEQAAINRLRREVAECGIVCQRDTAWQVADLLTLARIALREHRPDDGEALTEGWFISKGFRYSLRGVETNWEASLQLDDDTYLRIRRDETLLDVGHTYWECEHCETVGNVLRLCSALGIELKGIPLRIAEECELDGMQGLAGLAGADQADE